MKRRIIESHFILDIIFILYYFFPFIIFMRQLNKSFLNYGRVKMNRFARNVCYKIPCELSSLYCAASWILYKINIDRLSYFNTLSTNIFREEGSYLLPVQLYVKEVGRFFRS